MTAIVVIVTVLTALVSPEFAVLSWLLIFPYICLFGKRLHDVGNSAWMCLLLFVGYFVLMTMFTAIFLGVLSPEAATMQEEWEPILLEDGFGALMEHIADKQAIYTRASALTSLGAVLFGHAVLGWICVQLKSDPNANRYGPPTTGPYSGAS